MRVIYSSYFLKQLSKTNPALQKEVIVAVEKFADIRNHKALKVHRLTGKLKEFHAFAANYKIRVLFYYPETKIAHLVAFGSHDEIYR